MVSRSSSSRAPDATTTSTMRTRRRERASPTALTRCTARPTEDEIGLLSEGQVLICFLNGPQEPELVEKLADVGLTVFSNEAVPRTSAAQAMDALSSMGSIAGYKCALIAADTIGKYVPMLSTAAGTTKAANVMVFGVAVAGLQAIAIMNRLGAEVFAYDIRPETKEQ